MSVFDVRGYSEQQLELASPFSGCPSHGLGHGPVGGKVLALPSMWDASQSLLSSTLHAKGVSHRGREETAAGGGGNVSAGPPAAVSVHGDVLERVEVFKYLGRLLA